VPEFARLAQPSTIRWGRNYEPSWTYGAESTAPAAGSTLVSKTVLTGKTGYIHGFLISSGEENNFKVNWTSGGVAKSVRIVFSAKGSLSCVSTIPLNEGLPADAGTAISITNVNAGAAGVIYQASVLVMEVG
jgi:hypothetical protein